MELGNVTQFRNRHLSQSIYMKRSTMNNLVPVLNANCRLHTDLLFSESSSYIIISLKQCVCY